jgi:hypothetical protein
MKTCCDWTVGIWMITVLTTRANLLTNPGFETDGLAAWTTFGQGWRTGGGDDARSGSVGAVNDVTSSDSDEWRGLAQNVPVIPNNLYSGGVYVRAVSIGNSEAFFELQFYDEDGDFIDQHQTGRVTTDQAFTFAGLNSILAPAGAVTASVRAIVYKPASPSDPPDFVIFDDFTFANVTPAHAVLQNWGFEEGGFAGWTTFGQGWRIGTGGDAYAYDRGAVNDILTTDVDEWRGAFQNLPVTAGLTYSAGVYIKAVAVESSRSWLELQWLNSSGGVISQLNTDPVTADQGFQLASLHGITAPAGAVTASVRAIVHMLSTPVENPDFHIFDELYFLRPVDLTVTITASTNIVGANEFITYSLLVSNRSESMSGAYTVNVDLTTNLAYSSASAHSSHSGTEVNWALFGLPGGSATTLTVTATQPHYTGSTQEFSHVVSATVTSTIGDPISGNDGTSTETITVGIPMFTTLALLLLAGVVAWVFVRHHRAPAEQGIG